MCCFAFLALFATIASPVMAQPIDPHSLFETRCGRCHGHAGEFARKTFLIEDGELVIQESRQRLLGFLPNHFGKLTRDEISALLEAFQQQVETGGLYQEKCRICHDRARYLARQNLVLRNGQLVGRYTGADIKRLLSYHGRLSDDEQAIIYDMLVWQLETRQGQPAD